MKVKLGISKRHVHLNKSTWEKLFKDTLISKRNDITQPGEYASNSTIDLVVGGKTIEHVRVVGPLREYNQIEISESDAMYLGIMPPRRDSGELNGSLPITIVGPNGYVDLNEGTILAEKHIHMPTKMASILGIKNKDLMDVYENGIFLFKAKVKISDNAALELHIDEDEGKDFNLTNGSILEFKKSSNNQKP